MNVGLHQRAERSIYHPMARQSLNALEAIRDDSDDEVSSTIPSASMTSMSMTLVDDFKCVRAKRGLSRERICAMRGLFIVRRNRSGEELRSPRDYSSVATHRPRRAPQQAPFSVRSKGPVR